MNNFWNWFLRIWDQYGFEAEPVAWTGLIDALLMAGVTFGLPITPEQKTAIDGVLGAAAVVFARSKVTPVARLPVGESKPIN